MKSPFKKTLGAGAVMALFVLFCFAIGSCKSKPAPIEASIHSFDVVTTFGAQTTVKCGTITACLGSYDPPVGITGPKHPLLNVRGNIIVDSAGRITILLTIDTARNDESKHR
jgi:hypothetical protein